jgi:hypothetical protein
MVGSAMRAGVFRMILGMARIEALDRSLKGTEGATEEVIATETLREK